MADTQNANTQGSPDDIFDAVDSVSAQLKAIETFVARRFDEISMEINATSQQMDMAEEDMSGRFSEIMEIIKAVSFSGDGNTPANTGVELDAVVQATEQAANTIMDAADRISTQVNDALAKTAEPAAIEAINKDIEEIYMACSFQDITGQRVRKALENLKSIEDRLGTALDGIGVDVEHQTLQSSPVAITTPATQDDIDALFDD
ncbi:MAG: hypothetical protein GW778_04780 [Alphaproteobacteria bacterium]|nr:hypothetical protein [Alphaproteobacteria bacterium]